MPKARMSGAVTRFKADDSVHIAGSLDMHHATVDVISVANCEEMDMMLLLRFLFVIIVFFFWKGDLVRGSSRLFLI